MSKIPKKPENLSDNAFTVLIAAYQFFEREENKHFNDFSSFDFSREELERCFLELEDKRYVFWEDRGLPEECLYILYDPLIDGFIPTD